MAEKAVAEVKDTGKDLLEKITDMDVFRREDQVDQANTSYCIYILREIFREPLLKCWQIYPRLRSLSSWLWGELQAGRLAI